MKASNMNNTDTKSWTFVCSAEDVDIEDLIEVSVNGVAYAIYRSPEDEFFATAAHCTHEDVSLADGLVQDYIIECPAHNARFDYRTGEVKSAPACIALKTYPIRRENDRILIGLER